MSLNSFYVGLSFKYWFMDGLPRDLPGYYIIISASNLITSESMLHRMETPHYCESCGKIIKNKIIFYGKSNCGETIYYCCDECRGDYLNRLSRHYWHVKCGLSRLVDDILILILARIYRYIEL